jgi:hypothetical protein
MSHERPPAAAPRVVEGELSRLSADVVKRVQVPIDVADWIAEALRESREKRPQVVHSAGSARTGTFAENAGIELDVRSWKPFSFLREAVRHGRLRQPKRAVAGC